MFFWDEDNLRWMEDAANYTGYYQKLAKMILPYVKKEDTVCELGCGPGYLACALAPGVSQITALDISGLAIAKLGEKLASNHIANIRPVLADWHTWQPREYSPNGKFDVVLLSYFNALKRDWSRILELADRVIIAVLPDGERGFKMTCKNYDPLGEDEEGRETVVNVIPFLKNENVPYQLIGFDAEYGQPVRDLADAYNFLSHYYLSDEAAIKDYLQKQLMPLENGYYLPKLKKSGIIVIELKSM